MIGKLIVSIVGLWSVLALAPAHAQSPHAPPRNVDDIFALLNQYTDNPESEKKQALRRAEQSPPNTDDKTVLADFYRTRANAAAAVGRTGQYIADLRLVVEYGPERDYRYFRDRYRLANVELGAGSYQRALSLYGDIIQTSRGSLIGQRMVAHSALAVVYRVLGDWPAARQELANVERAFKAHASNPKQAAPYEQNRIAIIEKARAAQLESEGKLALAERARRRALEAIELDVPINRQRIAQGLATGTQGESEASHEVILLELAANLRLQGKLAEAEGVAREALAKVLGRIKRRYQSRTGYALGELTEIVIQQGRFREAERLAATAIDIFQKSAVEDLSHNMINARKRLGVALVGQELWSRAVEEFESLADNIRKDPFLSTRYPLTHIDWGLALVKAGQAQKGVPMLDTLTKTTSSRLSDAADETAQTRGVLAMALAASGNRGRALEEFRKALPVLLAYSGGDGDAENGGVVRVTRLRYILEAYLDLLIGQPNPGMEAISESFRVADAARGSTVQRALLESAARASISDTALAGLVREEQDVRVRLGVLTNLMGRLLSAPAGDQLPKVIAGIRTEIDSLRSQRQKLKADIDKRFPSYANLIDPKPATLDQARAALRPGETLISTYVGQDKTYIWAVPREGPPPLLPCRWATRLLPNQWQSCAAH